MKKLIILIFLFFSIMISFILSCADKSATEFDMQENTTTDIESTIDTIAIEESEIAVQQEEQPETFRFPTGDKHYLPYAEELTDKEIIYYTNQYLYKDDAIAALLTRKIQPFILYNSFILEDFDGINNINCNLAQFVAYIQSPVIYTRVNFIDYIEEYPNHIISQLVHYEKDVNNIDIDDLRYTDDMKEILIYLFGNENENLLDIENDIIFEGMVYRCDKNAGVVYLGGTVGYNSGSPQITSYTKTEDGYICDAILVPPYDNLYYDDGSVTPVKGTIKIDDIAKLTAYAYLMPKYRFEFKEASDGRLILNSQKTLYLPSEMLNN